MEINGTNDWYVGNNTCVSQPVNLVMVSATPRAPAA
jgi:hypothetical protein